MEPMTDELKETIIRDHPDGILARAGGGEPSQHRDGSRSALRQISGKSHSVSIAQHS